MTRLMDSTNRGALSRFLSDKGRILSEEEQAKENVYIQKWERERLEKQKQLSEKAKALTDKDASAAAHKVHYLPPLTLFIFRNSIL